MKQDVKKSNNVVQMFWSLGLVVREDIKPY